jgi:hypothetical protein
MELVDMPGHPAHALARCHKLMVEVWYTGELAKRNIDKPKERARELMLLLEGANAVMIIHRDAGYATAAAQAELEGTAVRLATARNLKMALLGLSAMSKLRP